MNLINELDFLNLLNYDYDEIINLANEITSNFTKLLVIGTGASVNNSRALMSCIKQQSFSVKYLDNIDPNTFSIVTAKIDPNETAILIISKSGETSETINSLKILITMSFTKNLYIITENKLNTLKLYSNSLGAKFIEHPKHIGGRFAIFTAVGLLPAAVAGVNLRKLKNTIEVVLHSLRDNHNSILDYSQRLINNHSKNITNQIYIYYGEQLKGIYQWVQQMYAESLGKQGLGFTPIVARGTIDQHSQLQLYLDGPRNNFFEIIFYNSTQSNKQFIELNNLFRQHAKATHKAILDVGKDASFTEFDDAYKHTIETIFKTMLSIIFIAKYWNINPFDQPAVELSKEFLNYNFR